MHPVAGLFRIVSSFLVLTFNLDQRGMATGYMPTFYTPLGIGFMRSALLCSDENGQKLTEKPHFYFRFNIFFDGNGIRFGKYGYRNGIGLRGSTETNQYGC